ncbi:MAG: endonuclease Q family protein [bacterium]|nr:endonuclease Q family protein [bacterium]MCX7917548.1 endonuclease Q family protein [bacterium]MDW8163969.1 endonuclease Q family protein [Candidatus Omnitrophota bacterium]
MYIADFHIHSKYSRATSKDMELSGLVKWAKYKGVNLLGTGDITHFYWFYELKRNLKESERFGIYEYGGIDFILTGEVCNIFEHKGITKKIHNIIFLSSLEKAEKFNRTIEKYGDLNSDGRPILQIDGIELLKILKENDEFGFIVPAHIWTPHFSLFGSNSGFDRIEDCFGELTDEIFALETGLSSDPEMNWRLSKLDRFSLISNSDAHSPSKIGREANIFFDKFDFKQLIEILKNKNFKMTIEYFPEEGKYHYDGHRNCNVCFSPEETRKNNYLCPVCGRKVTVGVMHRVETLADRKLNEKPQKFVPFKKLVPLDQIIGSVLNKEINSQIVQKTYFEIINKVGTEFYIFLEANDDLLVNKIDRKIFEGIKKVKNGDVNIKPGYDGEYGKVEILLDEDNSKGETLF